MAWVLVIGADDTLYQGAVRVIQPEGYDVLVTPSGATALQLLTDIAPVRGMIVLLRSIMGKVDAAEFLRGVAASPDLLQWNHAYILLDGNERSLSAPIEHDLAKLAVIRLQMPADPSDEDNWADLLDSINLADRQLLSSRVHS